MGKAYWKAAQFPKYFGKRTFVYLGFNSEQYGYSLHHEMRKKLHTVSKLNQHWNTLTINDKEEMKFPQTAAFILLWSNIFLQNLIINKWSGL